MAVRLQKYLADCGVASRRKCERLIEDGRVAVNGSKASIGVSIEPSADIVTLDGQPVRPDRKVYVVLNKPRGVITSVKDTHDRTTVIDLLKGVDTRVFPVGRLDMDVAGTLLLTNDGELGHRLAHPRFEVDKVYHAWVAGTLSDETARKLASGVALEDGMTAPAKVKVLKRTNDATLIRLVIHEGRKRLVKRMCAAAGHPVKSLRRIAIAGIKSGNLMPGEWRYMSEKEVQRLRRLTRMQN